MHFSFRIRILFFCSLTLLLVVTILVVIQRTNKEQSRVPFKNPDEIVATMSLPVLPLEDDAPISQKVVVTPQPAYSDGITAGAYIVGNLETGEVYLSRSEKKVFPIASISKLITAITSRATYASASSTASSTPVYITINEAMLEPYGTAGNLRVGEVFTTDELLYPLLLDSSNDAALALAYGTTTHDAFVEYMNAFSMEIGMEHSFFEDTSGLSDKNVSTVDDLFTLSKYIYAQDRSLFEFTRIPSFEMATTTDHDAHVFTSTNVFVKDPHFIGGKTGRTDVAHETMLSLFEYSVNGKRYPIAVIVLHSNFGQRQVDTSELVERFLKKVATIDTGGI